MPRAERLPLHQDSASVETPASVSPKEKEQNKERTSAYDLLVNEVSRLNNSTSSAERQEALDDVAMHLSAQRDRLSDHEQDLLRVDIGNLWAKSKGKRRTAEERNSIKELLTRLEPQNKASEEKPSHERAWAETDALIAAEQKSVVNEMVQHIQTDVRADADLTDEDKQTLEALATRMEEAVAAFDEGRLSANDFTADVTILLADLSQARNRIEGLVSARNTLKRLHAADRTSKEVVKMSRAALKKTKTQQNEAAAEIAAVADGLATDSGRETLPEIARADYKGPPDDLPVEETAAGTPENPYLLKDEKPEPIPLEVRKIDSVIEPEPPPSEAEQRTIEAVQYELWAKKQVDTFLKLDAQERDALLTEFKTFAAGGVIPDELSERTKDDFQKLVPELEAMQRTPDRLQKGEAERVDQFGISKKLAELVRQQPAGTESLLRVHTGSGWENFSPERFADRFVQLREKNNNLIEARLTRTVGQKIKGLFGRLIGKNPDNAIMSGFEQNEFKQMNDLLVEHEIVEKKSSGAQ